MPPPGFQIYLRPHVTLTVDTMTHKVDRFMHGLLVPTGIKFGFQNTMFTSLVADGRTDRLKT